MIQLDTVTSRRALLVGAVVGGTCATALAAPLIRALLPEVGIFETDFVSPTSVPTDDLVEWENEIGTVTTVEGGRELKLTRVTRFQPFDSRPREVVRAQPFALHFEVQDGQSLAGDTIYKANHPRLGSLEMFLSREGSTNRMQAVFA